MKGRFLLIAVFLFLQACAQLPIITPQTAMSTSVAAAECNRVFPEGNWQFLHTVEAEMPGNIKLIAMGLTVISSRQQMVRSVIMTVEGFVVFDGEYDQQLVVHRAFAPFDSPEFARGLMDDIRLIFFKPNGPVVEFGKSVNGSTVCRHKVPDDRFIDITLNQDGTWELRRYSPKRRITRTVKAPAVKWKNTSFPETIILNAQGNQHYKLDMTLVEALPVTH